MTLLALGGILCGLRARYGTGSAVVAHVVANGVSTVPVVAA